MPLITDIPILQHFELARGSSRPIKMVLTLADGTGPYILTGVSLVFMVKVNRGDPDSAALLTYSNILPDNSIVTLSEVLGIAQINRDPADLLDKEKFPHNVAREYVLKSLPGEDILAMGRWVVRDSGIDQI